MTSPADLRKLADELDSHDLNGSDDSFRHMDCSEALREAADRIERLEQVAEAARGLGHVCDYGDNPCYSGHTSQCEALSAALAALRAEEKPCRPISEIS